MLASRAFFSWLVSAEAIESMSLLPVMDNDSHKEHATASLSVVHSHRPPGFVSRDSVGASRGRSRWATPIERARGLAACLATAVAARNSATSFGRRGHLVPVMIL